MFPDTDSRDPFCLLTLTGKSRPQNGGAEFVFFAEAASDIEDDWRRFTLSAEDIALLNPNTQTCPIFRSKRDAELTKAIYRRVPVLVKEGREGMNPWAVKFATMFHMSGDSHRFSTRAELEAEGWRLSGNIFRNAGRELLPLYEAKMLHHFDHRWATYEGAETRELTPTEKSDPTCLALPRYWIDADVALRRLAAVPEGLLEAVNKGDEDTVRQILLTWFTGFYILAGEKRLAVRLLQAAFPVLPSIIDVEETQEWSVATDLARDFELEKWDVPVNGEPDDWFEKAEELIIARIPRWLTSFRDICRSTDERTAIFASLPQVGIGHTSPLVLLAPKYLSITHAFIANVSSFAFDYVTRQKVGGTHLNYGFIKQLPVLSPQTYEQSCSWQASPTKGEEHWTFADWLLSRVLELTYTTVDLRGFASTFGDFGEPYKWDEDRRFLLRCELDAAFFHFYEITRDDVDYIMETFPIVRRKDEQQYGEYRTKRLILEIYDEIARAVSSGGEYRTRLTPPPADPQVAHPSRAQIAPLVLPAGNRYPQPDKGIYEMRVVLSMLQAGGGSLDVQRIMIACSLLAMPDVLEKYAAATEGSIAHQWRRRFCDTFNPRSFLPTLDDLVRRGEIKLVRQEDGFVVSRVGTSAPPTDADIELDTRLALRVAASLSQAEQAEISPMATRQQIEARSKVA